MPRLEDDMSTQMENQSTSVYFLWNLCGTWYIKSLPLVFFLFFIGSISFQTYFFSLFYLLFSCKAPLRLMLRFVPMLLSLLFCCFLLFLKPTLYHYLSICWPCYGWLKLTEIGIDGIEPGCGSLNQNQSPDLTRLTT